MTMTDDDLEARVRATFAAVAAATEVEEVHVLLAPDARADRGRWLAAAAAVVVVGLGGMVMGGHDRGGPSVAATATSVPTSGPERPDLASGTWAGGTWRLGSFSIVPGAEASLPSSCTFVYTLGRRVGAGTSTCAPASLGAGEVNVQGSYREAGEVLELVIVGPDVRSLAFSATDGRTALVETQADPNHLDGARFAVVALTDVAFYAVQAFDIDRRSLGSGGFDPRKTSSRTVKLR